MNMNNIQCPSCESDMQLAFCAKASGLSYAKPDDFKNNVFVDKDLSEAGFRKLIPWKGEWHRAHICEACGIYTIEYASSYSRAEVEEMITALKQEA